MPAQSRHSSFLYEHIPHHSSAPLVSLSFCTHHLQSQGLSIPKTPHPALLWASAMLCLVLTTPCILLLPYLQDLEIAQLHERCFLITLDMTVFPFHFSLQHYFCFFLNTYHNLWFFSSLWSILPHHTLSFMSSYFS